MITELTAPTKLPVGEEAGFQVAFSNYKGAEISGQVNLTIRHDAGGYIEQLTQPLTVPGGGTQHINFTWTAREIAVGDCSAIATATMNSQTYGPRSEAFSVVNLSAQLLCDTGHGTYPSISGRHNGTIRPNETITLHALYTYPCAGTGGHTEYAVISWSNGTKIAEALWNGYSGDWHNISFNRTFALYANETYNYTIRTGSYPQIIHAQACNATGGKITCSSFVDINGKRHEGWIPAIRLD